MPIIGLELPLTMVLNRSEGKLMIALITASRFRVLRPSKTAWTVAPTWIIGAIRSVSSGRPTPISVWALTTLPMMREMFSNGFCRMAVILSSPPENSSGNMAPAIGVISTVASSPTPWKISPRRMFRTAAKVFCGTLVKPVIRSLAKGTRTSTRVDPAAN